MTRLYVQILANSAIFQDFLSAHDIEVPIIYQGKWKIIILYFVGILGVVTIDSGIIDCTQGHSADNPNIGILSCDYSVEILHNWFDNDRYLFLYDTFHYIQFLNIDSINFLILKSCKHSKI